MPHVAVLAYSISAVVFGLFGAYLLLGWRSTRQGLALLIAVACNLAWASANALPMLVPLGLFSPLIWALDVVRQAAWFGFLLMLLEPIAGPRQRWPVVATAIVVGAEAVALVGSAFGFPWVYTGPDPVLASYLAGAVLGLVLVEQVFRSVPGAQRWAIKPLCLGLAAGYIFELYLFAGAFLFGRPDPEVLAVRGLAHALTIPLIALSAGRNPDWALRIGVSRETVFHSTALALSGVYLLVIAGAGYYVRYVGGDWGRALQLTLFFAGLLLLGMFLFSGAQRARLRVFLNKHLFKYRYDYRAEWLRFTQALSTANGSLDLGESVIKALSDLVESPGGVLWLRDAAGQYVPYARLNHVPVEATEAGEGALARFLDEREWVVNLEEYRSGSGSYESLALPNWLSAVADAWLVLPLKSGGALIGFAVLSAPRTPVEVNWEVLDLLKTAQRQAASYLASMLAAEALLESRKFDSFNRMSAFVVHDLKNLVAQLALMLRNSERHRNNPEFQADMIATVAHVESRMRSLMTQLQDKSPIDPPRKVDLRTMLERLRFAQRHERPEITMELSGAGSVDVMAHPQRLERVVGHVLQNALEATSEDGHVHVRLEHKGAGSVQLSVEDDGCGMTKEFVRERLFRPFQTSKPGGMGIGAFEVQQYIHEVGGRIVVESEPGKGTQILIELPCAPRREEIEMKFSAMTQES